MRLLGLVLALTLASLAWAGVTRFYKVSASSKLAVLTSNGRERPDLRLLWKLRLQALAAEQDRKDLVAAGRLPDLPVEVLTPGKVGSRDWPLRRADGGLQFYWASADLTGALMALSVALAQEGRQVAPLSGRQPPREFLFEIVMGVSPDGRSRVIGGLDQAGLRSLRLTTGQAALRLPLPAGDLMTDAHYSRDGRYVAVGTGRELLLYDIRARQPYAFDCRLAEPRHLAVAFDPDSRSLAWSWMDLAERVQLSSTALPPGEKYKTHTLAPDDEASRESWPAQLPRPDSADLPPWIQSGG